MNENRDPVKDLKIDTTNLAEELQHYPSIRFFYAENRADSEAEYDQLKAEYEEVKDEIYLALKASGEKMTEAHIEAKVNTDAAVKEAKQNVIRVKRDLESHKNYCDCFKDKKDVLIQLNVDQRKENE